MDRAEKMDCRANGEVVFKGATTKFQLKMGLIREVDCNLFLHKLPLNSQTLLSPVISYYVIRSIQNHHIAMLPQ